MNKETRRVLFVVSGAALGAMLGGAAGHPNFQELRKPQIPETPNPFGDPRYIHNGTIVIEKGVNIRNLPALARKPKLHIPGAPYQNTIDWNKIEAINGTPLNGGTLFVIENSPIVYGEDTYKSPGRKPWWDTWIRLRVKVKGNTEWYFAFVDFSWQTEQFVKEPVPDYRLSEFERTPSEGYRLKNGQELKREEVGKITTLKNKDEVLQFWLNEMSQKIDGVVPTGGEYEKRYKEVEVVPADLVNGGWEELVRMKKADERIDVQSFPGETLPNGQPAEVLGELKLGTQIRNVVLVSYRQWGVFKRENIIGEIYNKNGQPINNIDPNKIMAMYSAFLLDPKSPRMQGIWNFN